MQNLNDLHRRKKAREFLFKVTLYFSLIIFLFDFNFYRYGVDIRLSGFMYRVVDSLEKEATQNYYHWRAEL